MTSYLMLAGGVVLLTVGAEWLVRGAASLARSLGLSPLVIGLTVVAFGTSAPELAVSLEAASGGQGGLAVGNVLGSNIANIALVLGLSSIIYPLRVDAQLVRLDIPVMIGVSFLGAFLLLDGSLSRTEGVILVALLVVYLAVGFYLAKQGRGDVAVEAEEALRGAPSSPWVSGLYTTIGLVSVVLGSHFLVEGGVALARAFGLSEAVIGLTLVAVGTSLPELATSLMAAAKKETDLAVGNVVGSNIFNILSILGFTATVFPFTAEGIRHTDLAVMLAVSLIVLPLARSRLRIVRAEGLLLLSGYGAYVGYLWLVP